LSAKQKKHTYEFFLVHEFSARTNRNVLAAVWAGWSRDGANRHTFFVIKKFFFETSANHSARTIGKVVLEFLLFALLLDDAVVAVRHVARRTKAGGTIDNVLGAQVAFAVLALGFEFLFFSSQRFEFAFHVSISSSKLLQFMTIAVSLLVAVTG
jgi:hypothetical protein